MREDLLSTDANSNGLLSYLRYNVLMSRKELNKLMKKEYTDAQVKPLTDMSNAAGRFELYDIGYTAGKAHMSAEHFPENFKVSK
jgi:hypothetical protein